MLGTVKRIGNRLIDWNSNCFGGWISGKAAVDRNGF